jgi:hypothetical protein
MLLKVLTMTPGAPAAATALLPAIVWTIIELQWTISLVESRTTHTQKDPARLPGDFVVT